MIRFNTLDSLIFWYIPSVHACVLNWGRRLGDAADQADVHY